MSLIMLCWMICERVGRTFVKGCEGIWVAKDWEYGNWDGWTEGRCEGTLRCSRISELRYYGRVLG